MVEPLYCASCGTSLGTAEIRAYEDRNARISDDGTIHFSSWEDGATVTVRCPDCSED